MLNLTTSLTIFAIVLAGNILNGAEGKKQREVLRWTNGNIPYYVAGRFSSSQVRKLENAMREWERYTCVRFTKVMRGSKPALGVFRSKKCNTKVGMMGRRKQPQRLNLGKRCFTRHKLLHELGHVIGLFHTHKRPDRDLFVTINNDNLRSGSSKNFRLDARVRTFNLPYSYRSIMHYPGHAFAVDKSRPTIVAKDRRYQNIMGKLDVLDFSDIASVNILYQCGDRCAISCDAGSVIGPNCRCWCRDNRHVAKNCGSGEPVAP